MEEKLREYIENIFSTVPCTVKAVELKEEVLQNLLDKYNDLIAEGKSDQAAYNISVASIGDINELLSSVRPTDSTSEETEEKISKNKTRNALLMSVAIALYILSPIPCIIFQDDIIGVVLMFVLIAVATGMIIFRSMTKVKYTKKDDTMVEDFKEWKSQDNDKKSIRKAISSASWCLIVAAYFIISFLTGAWHITWIIFLIGAAVEGIIKAIFTLID